ncbi:MAG: hypothetical protein K6F32_06145 [Bacilli bacterium]|nr:hypothetical protein [Bacilli bacterium]
MDKVLDVLKIFDCTLDVRHLERWEDWAAANGKTISLDGSGNYSVDGAGFVAPMEQQGQTNIAIIAIVSLGAIAVIGLFFYRRKRA